MAAKLTLLKRSAIPKKLKISSVTSEITRRLKFTSLQVDRKEQEDMFKQYMDELNSMGYSREWRVNVL